MCCFSTSIFSRLGLDFGRLWASKMEPSWLFWLQKPVRVALLQRLKLNVSKKLRLGGLQARFWRPQGSILEGLGTIFARFSHVLNHDEPRSNPSRNPSCKIEQNQEDMTKPMKDLAKHKQTQQ